MSPGGAGLEGLSLQDEDPDEDGPNPYDNPYDLGGEDVEVRCWQPTAVDSRVVGSSSGMQWETQQVAANGSTAQQQHLLLWLRSRNW
jgi:hypothetical protein